MSPNKISAELEKAQDLLESGDLKEARDIYEEILSQDSTQIAAYTGLGQIAFMRGFTDDAEVLLSEAYEIGLEAFLGKLPKSLPWKEDKNQPFLSAIHWRGVNAYRRGDISSAKDFFSTLMRLNPSDETGAAFFIESLDNNLKWDQIS